MTKQSLSQRWQDGDLTTFDALYAQHGQTIYRLGWAMLHDSQSAEDVVQETFLRAYKARDRFDPSRASIGTWLYQIALNYCRSTLRRRRFFTIPWGSSKITQTQVGSVGPELKLLRTESQKALWQAVQSLSPTLKEVITLHYYMELPAVEIATILDCPEGTIYSRLYNARRRLAKILAKEGITSLDILEVEHAP